MTQLIPSNSSKRPRRSAWMSKLRAVKTPGGRTELHIAVINDSELSSQPLTRSSTSPSSRNAAPDVNAQDELGRSALHWAAALGNTRWARHLMRDLEADGLLRDRDGKTALHEAATNGDEEMVKMLLEHQKVLGNIDAQDNRHRTALHWAADHGKEEVVLLLTASGANVLAVDASNNTALHRAVRNRREDRVVTRRVLSMDEADPGNTLRHKTAWKRCRDIVTHLLGKLTEDGERKALLTAIEQDHIEVAKELCRRHANNTVASSMDKGSWESLLWHAATTGDMAMAELLLQKNVDVNGWGPHAQRPLELAAMHGHDDMVQRLLLVENLDVNATASKWTALALAARDGHDAVVQKLLRVDNIDPNAACLDLTFFTPLQHAARHGHVASVELLLGHERLEVDKADSFRRTALSLAAENRHTAVLEALIGKGASVTLTDNGGDRRFLRGRSRYGRSRGRTPLSYAAEKGNMDAVRLLIEKGARMAPEGKNAILTGSGEFLRLEDADAKTPLQYARGHEDVFKLMLSELYRSLPGSAPVGLDVEAELGVFEPLPVLPPCPKRGVIYHIPQANPPAQRGAIGPLHPESLRPRSIVEHRVYFETAHLALGLPAGVFKPTNQVLLFNRTEEVQDFVGEPLGRHRRQFVFFQGEEMEAVGVELVH
ncbi:hypothetical protein PG997_000197 [Apiospora hydei]|uniref:Ankyrin repeat protein n=1 Tax=Apiospora hydei TaxID=1337664 RepID=A0ABR1XAA7_9PEZI